jgi:acetylornithine deacetylase/succinyl-diaminopimelate desuccinylase-like protein
MAQTTEMYAALDQAIPAVREEFETLLCDLVQIPTVSMDPAHAGDIQRGANKAAEMLRACNAQAEIVDTPGNPVVFGQFMVNSAYPTVAIYNHLDVQPANEPEWQREPFAFHREEDRYLGRGTTDDKGPALTALMAARFAVQHDVPLNVQFIWELEEEIGSPHFAHFIRRKRKALTCDSVLVSDTVWLSRHQPAVPYGLRGMLPLQLRLQTGSKDCHSGLTGGVARNPVGELASLIARCYDAQTGRVKIKGFYDDVRRSSRAELEQFLASGFSLATFKKAHGLRKLRTNDVREAVQAIWSRPTFEVHGISGGYQGPGVKTIVPASAEAKISMRLVPDQDPKRIFALVRDFVKQHNPDVTVTCEGMLPPYLGEFSGAYADAVREAVRFGFGKLPSFTREGGSIGAVVTLDQILHVPIMFLGLSLPEHGYHAPNENFDWGQASGGMRAFVRYFEQLSQMTQRAAGVVAPTV